MQHTASKDCLIKSFIDTNSFLWEKDERFKLSSGRPSAFYVNCKVILSNPGDRKLISQLMYEKIKTFLHEIDAVGGLAIGAIPISTSLSDHVYRETQESKVLRTFVVRKKEKEHGLRLRTEGNIQEGDRALVVDDVLTTGMSTIDAIEQGRAAGLKIDYAFVIVDRGEDNGKQNVEARGVKLLSLVTLDDLKAVKLAPKKQHTSHSLLRA